MKIVHRVGLSLDARRLEAFLRAGIDLEDYWVEPTLSMAVFEIDESDPRWRDVAALLRRFRLVDTVHTKFSAAELLSARYLTQDWAWTTGYPMPDDVDLYHQATYDLDNYCGACGTGLVQNKPFRMKGEPRWGKKSFLMLNWVTDEIFTTPEVWMSVLKPFGIGIKPVLRHRTCEPLETCVQIDLPKAVPLTIPRCHSSEYCPVCGRTRYDLFQRGFFPAPTQPTELHMFKSEQYFGTDFMAFKHILVSGELYREISARKLKGVTFGACADIDDAQG